MIYRYAMSIFLFVFSTQLLADSHCVERTAPFVGIQTISCSYHSVDVSSVAGFSRKVDYQLPMGQAPENGWPVVVVYQGALTPVKFTRTSLAQFSSIHELRTIKRLLDNGYAVVAPRALANVGWLTNTLGPYTDYEATTDFAFIANFLSAIKSGDFGHLDNDQKFAMGFSSGGYQTSRMAVTFPGEFRAFVIHSGSYANCVGPVCEIPETLPANHPPTLFLHGSLDFVVPWATMDMYFDRLLFEGVEVNRYTDVFATHQWLYEAPEMVLNWFERH